MEEENPDLDEKWAGVKKKKSKVGEVEGMSAEARRDNGGRLENDVGGG